MIRATAIVAMLLVGCAGTAVESTTAEPSPTSRATPSPAATATPIAEDTAICEVYEDTADDVRAAISALMENASNPNAGANVIGPVASARGRLEIIARDLEGEEREDVEALAEGLLLDSGGEGFLANMIDAWDAFYVKYAERCRQPVND